MQPNAHISTLLVKVRCSSSINSGARYPDEPRAYTVVLAFFDPPSAVRPKSVIFHAVAFHENNTKYSETGFEWSIPFRGFKSRWISPLPWIKAIALVSCSMILEVSERLYVEYTSGPKFRR